MRKLSLAMLGEVDPDDGTGFVGGFNMPAARVENSFQEMSGRESTALADPCRERSASGPMGGLRSSREQGKVCVCRQPFTLATLENHRRPPWT